MQHKFVQSRTEKGPQAWCYQLNAVVHKTRGSQQWAGVLWLGIVSTARLGRGREGVQAVADVDELADRRPVPAWSQRSPALTRKSHFQNTQHHDTWRNAVQSQYDLDLEVITSEKRTEPEAVSILSTWQEYSSFATTHDAEHMGRAAHHFAGVILRLSRAL